MKIARYFLFFLFVLFPLLLYQEGASQGALPEKCSIKRSPKVALTFDADMTAGMLKRLNSGLDKSLYDTSITAYLIKEKVSATIFITGLWAEKYSSEIEDLAADSLFEFANHSYSHRGFTKSCYHLSYLPDKEKESDIMRTQKILACLTGKTPSLFRFPGGCTDSADIKLVNRLGLKVITWSFPSGDAFSYDLSAIVRNVEKNVKDGSIIVFHLSGGRYAPKTAAALKQIIPELKKRGYEFVTVSNL